jgi:hypothetical protein
MIFKKNTATNACNVNKIRNQIGMGGKSNPCSEASKEDEVDRTYYYITLPSPTTTLV